MSEASQPNYTSPRLTPEERAAEVLRVARRLHAQQPDWATFFKLVFGVDGIVARMFQKELRTQFEQSDEYSELQRMLSQLRQKDIKEDAKEPTRMITVRLPASLHEALRKEAHDRHTSINKLCITKLLQVIEEQMLPEEQPAAGAEDEPPLETD